MYSLSRGDGQLCVCRKMAKTVTCEQVSADMHGLVTRLPAALPRGASVTVRPHRGNIPLFVFFSSSHFVSMVCSLSLHNLMIVGFGSNSGLCSPILSSIPCYSLLSLSYNVPYSFVVREVMLWTAAFKNM